MSEFPMFATALGSLLLVSGFAVAAAPDPSLDAATRAARTALVARHGESEAARIDRGLSQVRRYWRTDDGDAPAFEAFAVEQFVPAGAALDRTFERLEFALERQDGYLNSLVRDLRRGAELELGPKLALDGILAGYDPAAHVAEDSFRSRLAFVALLNFPETTLAERLAAGGSWTRRQWAEARLAGRFGVRVPAEVQQKIATATAAADSYIAGYNIRMDRVLTPDGKTLFPDGLRLISHWNLRDQIKADYAEKDGLARQRLITLVMEKIVRQEIPKVAIDNPRVAWTPSTGKVVPAPGEPAAAIDAAREPDTRYRTWLDIFHAMRAADPFDPLYPNAIDRSFQRDREIPEAEVRALFTAVLDAPVAKDVAALIAKRLGRPLEPFDIWYAGFKPRAAFSEAKLDELTRKRYPNADAFAADLPRILTALGFSPEKAAFLAQRIVVDPARGAGHAFPTARRDDAAHLRTRINPGGMDYKGYNIAVHELGHNVEQVFSTVAIDHTLLRGVPNNAFTEAMAFLFQDRDLELLGLPSTDPAAHELATLENFWAMREIAAVALVDVDAWHFLYAHPDATPAQFREAVVSIAQAAWNRWFAPYLGQRDVALLAIYSHMVSYPLYTPDYPLGHLIAFEVGEHFRTLKDASFGAEFERITKLGSITPDAWIRAAVAAPLSAAPLIEATKKAVGKM